MDAAGAGPGFAQSYEDVRAYRHVRASKGLSCAIAKLPVTRMSERTIGSRESMFENVETVTNP